MTTIRELVTIAVGAGTGVIMSLPEGQHIEMHEADAMRAVDAILADLELDPDRELA